MEVDSQQYDDFSPPRYLSSSNPPSSDYEPELTPIEYARHHGLLIELEADFRPDGILQHALQAAAATHVSADADIVDARLPTVFKRVPPPPQMHEQLTANKRAGKLLAELLKRLTREESDKLSKAAWAEKAVATVELPLLRSDHDGDCRAFYEDVRKIKDATIDPDTIPLIPGDVEKDETLEFPPKAHAKGAEVLQTFATEKPESVKQVRKETMMHLQRALDKSWTDADAKKLWDELHTRVSRPARYRSS
jgi:hypothetical protein